MLRSIYMSATNMITQRRKMDVVTQNLSNAETTGFKADKLVSRSFEDELMSRVGDPAIPRRSQEVGTLNYGVHIDEVVTIFDQGSPEETTRNEDFALLGEGYFVLDTPAGLRYTRDGHFFFNEEGLLVNADGYTVMGVDGPIVAFDDSITVDEDGRMFTSDGAYFARLSIMAFDDEASLRKVGNNMFMATQAPREAVDVRVKQGYLENSNVQVAAEMVDMMSLYRSYETSQRIVKMLDESLQKTVNEVGRV